MINRSRRIVVQMLGALPIMGVTLRSGAAGQSGAAEQPPPNLGPWPSPNAPPDLFKIPAPTAAPPAGGGEAGVVDMGRTFYAWEGRALRVTTKFDDSSAISERFPGYVETTTHRKDGELVSRFRTDRRDGGRHDFVARGVDTARLPQGLTPTLDWTNVQGRLYDRDDVLDQRRATWRGALLRRQGSSSATVEDGVREVRTEFADGSLAVTQRGATKQLPFADWISRLYFHDTYVGTMWWNSEYRVLGWNFIELPRREHGYLNDERLATAGEGWKVLPTMAWANVQIYGLYNEHRKKQLNLSASTTAPAGLRLALQRFLDAFVVPVYANEPGCDGLHWLDNTSFRPCCDRHDLCYETYGCTDRSWWTSQGGWRCDMCNIQVVGCFGTEAICTFFPWCCW